jgi:hypothetical protein
MTVAHSITSSARASNVSGTVRPIAFAVLRLSTSSYVVGACTGCRIAGCYNVIPGIWQTSNSAYLIIRSETDTYRRFTAKADLVRGGRGGWRMPVILTDFLLFCCMAAFAIGVVIAAASIIG